MKFKHSRLVHTSRETKAWLQSNRIEALKWPVHRTKIRSKTFGRLLFDVFMLITGDIIELPN